MDFLKTFWPTPFIIKEKDTTSFIVQLLILIIVCSVAGIVIGAFGGITVIGLIVKIVCGLIDLYGFIGIVLCILQFLGLLK